MDKKFLIKRENNINRLPTVNTIETIMANNGLNLKVNNIEVYHTAFVHRSYLRTGRESESFGKCVPLQKVCNETYEFLGDTILNSVIGTYLYDRYRDQNEGFLTKTRTKMVRGTTLGEMAKRLGLHEWIIISQHVESEGGRDNPRILEDLFEAFIAAIYLDNGSELLSNDWFKAQEDIIQVEKDIMEIERVYEKGNLPIDSNYIDLNRKLRLLYGKLHASRSNGYIFCQKFIIETYERHIDIVKLIAHDDNYKDQLQHYFQRKSYTFPIWELLKEEGKTNNRWHTVGVKDRFGYLIAVGRARKKTDAEQLASRNVLVKLGAIDENHGIDFFKT
jgi:dsRNA-specific ribonuclease